MLRPPDPDSDRSLFRAAQDGDRAALARLYERHRQWIVDLAHRTTGDREIALDALQETMRWLLARLEALTAPDDLRALLYPAVRHAAIALRRARDRRPDPFRLPSPAPSVPEPAAPLESAEADAELVARVERLSPEHREVVLLHYGDGLALADVAQALGVPLGTVKSRLHAALARLRAEPT